MNFWQRRLLAFFEQLGPYNEFGEGLSSARSSRWAPLLTHSTICEVTHSMSDQKLTDEFGAMTYVSAGGRYEPGLKVPHVGLLKLIISAEGFEEGLEQTSAFLAWLSENQCEFKLSLEREIQNYDVIWDDVWDSVLGNDWIDAEDGFLGEYLRYESVEFRQGTVHIRIDTSGLHMDHKIRATISDTMQIRCCELM